MEGCSKACWPYLVSDGSGFPTLGLDVRGPLGVLTPEDIPIRVDTGYDGFLLLSERMYNRIGLRLSELPKRYWPEGETITGEIFRLRRALIIVHIQEIDARLEGYAETFRGNTEDLIGMKLIEPLKLLLDGPEKLACLIK